ncbi:MAG: YraN family protein [Thermodesulfovibrionales bacterium]
MTNTKNSKGSRGKGRYSEEIVVAFLNKKGFQIIKKNYLTPVGEIDIIARYKGQTVFVEVKSAYSNDPIESVNQSKIKKIRSTALYYMKELGYEIDLRFDVITVVFDEDGKVNIRHIEGAF